jgi:hypothetical protein
VKSQYLCPGMAPVPMRHRESSSSVRHRGFASAPYSLSLSCRARSVRSSTPSCEIWTVSETTRTSTTWPADRFPTR